MEAMGYEKNSLGVWVDKNFPGEGLGFKIPTYATLRIRDYNRGWRGGWLNRCKAFREAMREDVDYPKTPMHNEK